MKKLFSLPIITAISLTSDNSLKQSSLNFYTPVINLNFNATTLQSADFVSTTFFEVKSQKPVSTNYGALSVVPTTTVSIASFDFNKWSKKEKDGKKKDISPQCLNDNLMSVPALKTDISLLMTPMEPAMENSVVCLTHHSTGLSIFEAKANSHHMALKIFATLFYSYDHRNLITVKVDGVNLPEDVVNNVSYAIAEQFFKAVKENKSSPGIYWVKAAILLSSRSIKLSHGFSSNISPVFKKDVLLLERKIALLNQVNPVSESSFVEGYFSASTIDNTAIKIGERRICPSRCMNRPIRLLKNSVCSFTCNIQTISAKNKEFCKPIKEKKQKNLIAAKPSLNEATCPVNGTFGVNSTSFTPTVMFNVSPGTKTTEYSLFNLHYNCLKFLYSLFSQFKIFEGLVNDNLSYSISEESVKKIGFKEIFLWQHHITGPVTEANQVADHFINHSIKHFIPLTTGNFKRRFIEPTPTQKSTKAIPTNFTDDIFAANYAKAVPTIFKFGKLIDDDHQVKSTSAQHSWRLEATPTVFKVYNVEATPVVFKVRKFEATPTVLNVQKVEATRTVFKVQKVEATSAVFKDYKIVTTSVKMNSAVYSRTKPTVFNVVSVSQVEPTATRGYIHVYPGSRPTAIKYKVNDYVNLPGDNNLESTSYFPSGKNAICSKSSIEVKKIAGNFFNSRFTSRQPYFTSQWDFLKSTNLSEGMENYIQAKQIKSGSKTIKNLYNIASNAFMPSFFVHNLIHLGVNVTNPSEVVVGPKFGIKNVVVDSKFIDTKCVNEFTLRSALVSDDIDFFSNAGKEIETHRRNRFNNGRLLEKKSLGIYDALSLPSDEYDTERHCKNRICEDDKKKPDSYNITFPNLESLKYCYTAEKKINILKYFEDSLVFRANFKENLRKFIGHQGNIVTTNKFSRNDSNGGSFKIYNINVESAIFEKLLVVTKLWIKEFALIFAAIAGWKHLIDEILKGFEKFNLKWGAIVRNKVLHHKNIVDSYNKQIVHSKCSLIVGFSSSLSFHKIVK